MFLREKNMFWYIFLKKLWIATFCKIKITIPFFLYDFLLLNNRKFLEMLFSDTVNPSLKMH